MPFSPVDLDSFIEEQCKQDPKFKQRLDVKHEEYEFIKSLVKARKEKGLTQKEVAEMADLTQQAVSRVEKLGNSPSLSTVMRYVDILGLKLTVVPKDE